MKESSYRAREEGKTIGLVPTMGYFHKGHLSLMERARKECGFVVVSLFVNPIQFGPQEDYHRYPRDEERDKKLAEEVGVDVLFIPSVEEMYPEGYSTYVEVIGLTEKLCGRFRPGHFRGVTTVVLKLFNIVNPHKAYFGEKDYQQLKVVERMTKDLNLDIQIVPCPIVREADGLAMSSRNVYLSPEERKSATIIYKSLTSAKEAFLKGERDARKLREIVESQLKNEKLINKIDYIEVVHPETLDELESVGDEGAVIAVALYIGKARLIDNIILRKEVEQ
ncbi:pantoate--beta-alanine ligase [bacterium]|nr:pantoate--beta-alanine ligase [bacterium]